MEDRKARVLPTDIDVLYMRLREGKSRSPRKQALSMHFVTKHCEKYVTAKTKAEKMKVSKTIILEVLTIGSSDYTEAPHP